MREIKFRGMEVFDKKWVYGWLANIAATSDKRNNKGWRIIENISDGNVYTPVIPDTVGEFAGLSDINGKEIYEGDMVRVQNQYETDEPIDSAPNKVYFHDGAFRCGFHNMILGENVCTGKSGNWNMEVIGNIYENPEMVKE